MTLKLILIYVALGILVPFLFDLFTAKIRRGMSREVVNVQSFFMTGYKTSVGIIIVSLIVLWPFLILGAVLRYGGKSES